MDGNDVPGKFEQGVVKAEALIRALVEKDGCYATNGWLSKQLGVSPRQVARYLQALRERGVIRWHSKRQHKYGKFLTRRQIFFVADLEGPTARPERLAKWVTWTYEPPKTILQRVGEVVEAVADVAMDVCPVPCGEAVPVEEDPRPVDVAGFLDSPDFLNISGSDEPDYIEGETEVQRLARQNHLTVEEYLAALADLAKPLPPPAPLPKLQRAPWKPGTYPIPDPATMTPTERANIDNWGEKVPEDILLDFTDEEFDAWMRDRCRRYEASKRVEMAEMFERGKIYQAEAEAAQKKAAQENPFLPGGDFYIASKPDDRPYNKYWEERPRYAPDPEIGQFLRECREKVREDMARGRPTTDWDSWYERAKRGELPDDSFVRKCQDGRVYEENEDYHRRVYEEADDALRDPKGTLLKRFARIKEAAITGDYDDGEFYDDDPLGEKNQ